MVYNWEPQTHYNVGSVVSYQGVRYRVIQAHTSQSDWTPPIVPALFERLPEEEDDRGRDEHHHQEHRDLPAGHGDHPNQGIPSEMNPPQPPSVQGKTHHSWLNLSDERKKELEIGGGLVAGLAAVGAGYYAYHEHEKNEDKKKAHVFALSNWLREAEARRDDYHNNGPRGPVTWILIKDHVIPPEAIEGGRSHGKPLYICRAYYEGGIQIGIASPETKKGAVFGYGGSAIDTGTYEILIGDSRGIRWVEASSGLTQLGGCRPVEGGHESDGELLHIAQVRAEGNVYPGKVSLKLGSARATYQGSEHEVKEFKVLCYA